jgi:hypothetical protein
MRRLFLLWAALFVVAGALGCRSSDCCCDPCCDGGVIGATAEPPATVIPAPMPLPDKKE